MRIEDLQLDRREAWTRMSASVVSALRANQLDYIQTRSRLMMFHLNCWPRCWWIRTIRSAGIKK